MTGVGNFSYWIERLQEHYLEKTGMRLFPGTLNVQLDEPYELPRERGRLEARDYAGALREAHGLRDGSGSKSRSRISRRRAKGTIHSA